MRRCWLVVVPVKPLPVAKTRLRGAVPDASHPELVLAMAQDTVAAALSCEAVCGAVVVCDDPTARAALTALGARCLDDVPSAGLNAALVYATLVHAAEVAAGAVGQAMATAALTADLPALRPVELAAALLAAAESRGRAYVPDADETGTVLLTAPAGTPLAPRFGPGSAAAHRRSGARRLDGTWPTLRRDVDTANDLDAAKALGLGPYTDGTLCAIASKPT
jgi:2-phospho-L-lactate/phosphoenolpyruvate guanylyltransferase